MANRSILDDRELTDKERNTMLADNEYQLKYWKDDEYFKDDPNYVFEKPIERVIEWPPSCPHYHTQESWNQFIKEYERVILKKDVK